MRFLLLFAVAMVLGHIVRPLLISEEAQQLAVVSFMILAVMIAVEEQEKHAPLQPKTKRLLSPFRHWSVIPALLLYLISWLYAQKTPGRFIADILR